MQRIELIGNLVKDATRIDPRKEGGRTLMAFRIACNEAEKNARVTTYYDIYKTYDGAFEYLKKGMLVYVEGKPFVRNVEHRSDICVDCTYIQFLSPSGKDDFKKNNGKPVEGVDFKVRKI